MLESTHIIIFATIGLFGFLWYIGSTTGNLLEGEQLAVPHVKIQRVEQKIRFIEVGNLG